MRKAFWILLFSAFIGLEAQAQRITTEKVINLQNFDKQRIHFGYYVGFNYDNYKIDQIKDSPPILVEPKTGFNIGLVANLRLHKNFDLRFEPGLSVTERSLNFLNRTGFTKDTDTLRVVKSTYIHFPLLVRFSSNRFNNIRPYVMGGLSYSRNLSSNEDNLDDNSNGTFRTKTNTFYYELGVGIDFYLVYFKFSPSIRGIFALTDELVPDENPYSPWTSNIQSLKTRGIFINFTFH